MTRQRGFTLIEMVMTMIVIGILSTAAYFRFNPAIFELRGAADDLIGAIRHTQGQAMSHSGIDTFSIVIQSHGYSILRNGNPMTDPMTGTSGFGQTWPNITISPTATIAFDGNGAPGLGSALTLTLNEGSENTQIVIQNETGFVE